jgi:hypothetical protein
VHSTSVGESHGKADEDSGEPAGRIDGGAAIIDKVRRTPGRWHFTLGLACSAWVRPRSHSPYKMIMAQCTGWAKAASEVKGAYRCQS